MVIEEKIKIKAIKACVGFIVFIRWITILALGANPKVGGMPPRDMRFRKIRSFIVLFWGNK